MQLPRQPRTRSRESITPMINVVFLLLIFFLLTAQIAPPEPFDVQPPMSETQTLAEGDMTLYIDVDGNFALGDARGDQALAEIAVLDDSAPLLIRADRHVSAARVAKILTQISSQWSGPIKLIAEGR